MVDPYEAFERDIPEALREDALTAMCEATSGYEVANVHILDRDQIDAINARASGIITIEGEEYSFHLESGNWNGTVLLAWQEDKAFEHRVPTRWALQPTREIIGKHLAEGKGSFLLLKWDAILKNWPKVAEIPGKYAYDRRVQPGHKVETYWKAEAAKHNFVIVSQEEADETRAMLAKAA